MLFKGNAGLLLKEVHANVCSLHLNRQIFLHSRVLGRLKIKTQLQLLKYALLRSFVIFLCKMCQLGVLEVNLQFPSQPLVAASRIKLLYRNTKFSCRGQFLFFSSCCLFSPPLNSQAAWDSFQKHLS